MPIQLAGLHHLQTVLASFQLRCRLIRGAEREPAARFLRLQDKWLARRFRRRVQFHGHFVPDQGVNEIVNARGRRIDESADNVNRLFVQPFYRFIKARSLSIRHNIYCLSSRSR